MNPHSVSSPRFATASARPTDRRSWRAVPVLVVLGGLLGSLVFGQAVPLTQAASAIPRGSAIGAGATVRPSANPTAIAGLRRLTLPAHAGYSLTISSGSFSTISGRWIEPAIDCTDHNALLMVWVGLDDNGRHLEQAGSFADCRSGAQTHTFFYEMYPALPVTVPLPITAGDAVGAEVRYAKGQFTLTVHDYSSGQAWSTVQKSSAGRVRAQWLLEAPLPYALAPFGSVTFNNVSASDSAGHRGGLGQSAWQAWQINMGRAGDSLAVTASPVKSGTSFRVSAHSQ